MGVRIWKVRDDLCSGLYIMQYKLRLKLNLPSWSQDSVGEYWGERGLARRKQSFRDGDEEAGEEVVLFRVLPGELIGLLLTPVS